MQILTHPCHNNNTYIWRIGEYEFLTKNNLLDTLLKDDGSLWVRSVPELVFGSDLNMIQLEESKYNIVYNTYRYFNEWNNKELAFKIWGNNNINVPDWIYVNSIGDIYDFIEKHDHIVLRINNNYGCKDTFFLSYDQMSHNIIKIAYEKLNKSLEHKVKQNHNTKIIAVKFLYDNTKMHKFIRSFVVNGEVILSVDHGGLIEGSTIYYDNIDYGSFIKRNKELSLTDETQRDLINCVACFDIDISSVDWIQVDNKCYILEINPYWGMGYASHNDAFPFNGKWAYSVRSEFDTLPSNLKIRLDLDRFWDNFYKKLLSV